jgi:hypothetical protein
MLKYFAISIIINLLIGMLFVIFIMQPMQVVGKVVAQIVCQNWNQKCIFKE